MTQPRQSDVKPLGSILSIWAHPDDETYLAGGVMAMARDLGQRVVCATASAGELGTSEPNRWTPDRLGRIRRWEAAAAMTVLGVVEHHVLGLPDGALADHHDAGIAWVAQLLRDAAPDTILTFGPDGATFHPDHIAVHRWVTDAWDRCGRPGRLLYAAATREHLARFGDVFAQVGVYMAGEPPTGRARHELALHLHLDGALLDRKLTALRALATQTTELQTALGLETYTSSIAQEAFVAAGQTVAGGHGSTGHGSPRDGDESARRPDSRDRWPAA